jgi:hypothetical protein
MKSQNTFMEFAHKVLYYDGWENGNHFVVQLLNYDTHLHSVVVVWLTW